MRGVDPATVATIESFQFFRPPDSNIDSALP